jgi:predicted dehydrogenase
MLINTAVIGTGIGEKHVQAIDFYKKFRVKIICEKDKSKISLLKKKYKKIRIVSDESEIFNDNKIKLVSIASYDEDHYRQIKKCIKLNKLFIVEKPICLNLNNLCELNQLLKKKKINLYSNLVLRVNSLFKNIKKKISKKDIFYIEADYIWGRKHKLFGWRSKTKRYSITLGAGIHVIDLVMWMLNSRPISVSVYGSKKATLNTSFKKENFLIYIFEFPQNIIVKITANAAGVYEHFHKLKIFEKNKTIDHNLNTSQLFLSTKNKISKKIIKGHYPDKVNRKKLIQNFLDHILNKKTKLLITNKEQMDLMSVCFFADKSLRLNKKLKIKYFK